jgi:hypothetical protein
LSTHLRIAATIGVLSTSFMIAGAGGAVASADTEAGSTTTSTSAGPTRDPVKTFADNVRKAVENSLQSTVQGVTGTLSTLAKPGLPSDIPESPKTTFGGSPTVFGSSPATTPDSEATTDTATDTPAEAPSDVPAVDPAPTQEPAAPVTAPVVTVPTIPTVPTAPAVAPKPVKQPVTKAITSVTSLATSVFAVPGVVASLSTSATPVSDFLASIQNVFNSAGDAGASLTALPSDLAGLLLPGVSGTTPSIGASTGLSRPVRVTAPAPGTPTWSALPQLPVLAVAPSHPDVIAPATPVSPMDVVAISGPVSSHVAETPPASTPEPSGKSDVLTQVEHAIGAFVATVSLTALAAVALPGLLGLLTTCAAGIRVGYRQAKAASMLPHTAISRFVGSGPIGVVRSSSQVEMRSRAPRVVRRAPVPAERTTERTGTLRLLDKAV